MNAEELNRDEIIENRLTVGDCQSAESFALAIESEWQKAESLTQVARAWVSVGQLDDAQRVRGIAIITKKVLNAPLLAAGMDEPSWRGFDARCQDDLS